MADKNSGGARARGRPSDGARPRSLYAAVDLGTNNCRLLVAEPRGRTFRIVDSYSQIARLGEGLQASGRLSDEAIDRALGALRAIRQKLRNHGVSRTRCIATEACRKAENGPEFIRRVQSETGLTFKIIGPKEEARLASLGCHDLLEPDADAVLVVDIGGGSTELTLIDAAAARSQGLQRMIREPPLLDWVSLKVGVVTLYDTVAGLDEDEAWPLLQARAREAVAGWRSLPDVQRRLASDNGYLIGTSGTVTCVAGVHLGLDRYRRDRVDGIWLDRTEAAETLGRLRSLDVAGRSALPTIGPERAPLMLAGCAIMEAVWDAFGAQRMRVADRGLREGILLSMMYGKPRRQRRPPRRRPPQEAEAT
jgi:exopolyphosphatase/guanosine-5'-triphosphate,3'-diphosphate pyrophosphatase